MKCAALNCHSSNDNKACECSFFHFPSDAAIKKKWIQFCGRGKSLNPKTSVICMLHFQTEDFENNVQFELGFSKKRLLKKGAIPLIRNPSDNTELNNERALRIKKRENKRIVELILQEYDANSKKETGGKLCYTHQGIHSSIVKDISSLQVEETKKDEDVKIENCMELDLTKPDETEERLLWFKAINMEYSITTCICVCRIHFSDSNFVNNRLTTTAVPDQNLQLAIVKATNEESDVSDVECIDCEGCVLKESLQFDPLSLQQNEPISDNCIKQKLKVDKKSTKPKTKVRIFQPTPMATLEMKLTTKELKTIQNEQLPKLLTQKADNSKTVQKKLPTNIKLPKSITIKVASSSQPNIQSNQAVTPKSDKQNQPSNSWKTQVEELRTKVEQKLKDFKENEVQVNKEFPSIINKQSIIQVEASDFNVTSEELKEKSTLTDLTCYEKLPSDDDISIIETIKANTKYDLKINTDKTSQQIQNCGYIQRLTNNTFRLTCFYCLLDYELENWKHYVEHFNKVHFSQKTKKPQNNKSFSMENKKIFIPKSTNKDTLNDNSLLDNWNKANELNSYDKSAINIDSDSISLLSSQEGSLREESRILNFKKSKSARILKFLKTLQTHPLLWHSRRRGPIQYDEETEKFISDYDRTLTVEEFRISLENVQAFYNRYASLPSKCIRLEKNTHFKEYINMINEIIEQSKLYAHYCDHCTFFSLDKDRLLTHEYLKHSIGNMPYVCSCGLRFEKQINKETHENSHKPSPKFTCEHCGFSFLKHSKLKNHLALKHPETLDNPYPYECSKCNVKLPTPESLSQHIRKHDPPRFQCNICEKLFSHHFRYKVHMKAHLNQRDQKCEDCGKGFYTSTALKKHRLRIHNEAQYHCKPCGVYFICEDRFVNHNQTFHPNGTNLDRVRIRRKQLERKRLQRIRGLNAWEPKKREFKCKECGILFQRLRDLQRHKRELGHYLGDRLYKCPYCNMVLSSGSNLARHLNVKHNSETEIVDIKDCKLSTKVIQVEVLDNVVDDSHNVTYDEETTIFMDNLNCDESIETIDQDIVVEELLQENPILEFN